VAHLVVDYTFRHHSLLATYGDVPVDCSAVIDLVSALADMVNGTALDRELGAAFHRGYSKQ
jgi:hypothetical protein